MKKTLTKILSVLMALIISASFLSLTVWADGTVSLRIEGPDKNYYYNTSMELLTEDYTVADLIACADETDDSLTVTGINIGYISAVNGVKAGSYTTKKWDGWVYTVNGDFPNDPVTDYVLESGDEVILFYSDYYNAGMEIPVVDSSKLSTEGIINFTYGSPIFDKNYAVVGYDYKPIVGASVTFNGKDYTTDKNGNITVDNFAKLRNGSYSLQINKYFEGGCPAVLRLAPDFTVKVTGHSVFDKIINFFKMIFDFFKNLFTKK